MTIDHIYIYNIFHDTFILLDGSFFVFTVIANKYT